MEIVSIVDDVSRDVDNIILVVVNFNANDGRLLR